MFGWGKKDKPKKKRNVPDVEIHVPELDIDRLETTLENLRAHVDVDATIGRPGNEFLNISIQHISQWLGSWAIASMLEIT